LHTKSAVKQTSAHPKPTTDNSATTTTRIRFVTHTTKKEEPATRLFSMYNRCYCAESGRFISASFLPVTAEPPYLFADCNPLLYADPSGLAPEEKTVTLPDVEAGPKSCISTGAMDNWGQNANNWVSSWEDTVAKSRVGDAHSRANKYANGFRHCLMQCVLARRCGFAIAVAAAVKHEYDANPNEVIKPTEDTISDLKNNKVGRDLGLCQARRGETCHKLCNNAAMSNRLILDYDLDYRAQFVTLGHFFY